MVEITMSGPGKNSLGTAMMSSLMERIGAAGGQPLLLTGEGDAFSAGLNLKEVAALDPAGMEAFLQKLETLMCTLFLYPGPTVALVNGHAIAGGGVLTLCCDHRVAARSKMKIGLNEVALGLRFPPRVMGIVKYRIPPPKLEQVVLGAQLHDPESALRLGLIDEVSDTPRAAAEARLAVLAAYPPAAYASAKLDLRSAAVGIDDEAQRAFIRDVLPAWTSPELKAMLTAVLAR